jgi:putative holliday junction resolvase
MKDKKILSIDLGKSKTGLAMAESGIVFPLKVISGKENCLEKIIKTSKEEEIDLIVIGIAGSEQKKIAEEFGKELEKRLKSKIYYQDENLTTREAVVKMIEAGKSRKYRKEKDDLFAACLILERFLEKNDY